jgi:DNA-binding LacI/PurR family transcriptional regulator
MHKSTVSLALSGKGNVSQATRQRVLRVAGELGYEPNPIAQRLAHGHRNSVAPIISGTLDVGLTTEKILRIQRELSARGLEAPIYTSSAADPPSASSQAAQIKQVCRQRPRAIVCAAQTLAPTATKVFAELAAYQSAGGIVVSYDVSIPLACDQVIFDREDNAYQAARHLIRWGHRKIGFGMSLPAQTGDNQPGSHTTNTPQALRLRGFRRALDEAGIAWRDDWFFPVTTYEKGGAQMAERFLRLPLSERPTGLCVVNDYVAFACMVEMMRAGARVPDNVSVVGHDDQPIAAYCPVPLSAVSQPVDAIARAVVDLLAERLEGSEVPPRTIVIRGELIERASVAAPPHEQGAAN